MRSTHKLIGAAGTLAMAGAIAAIGIGPMLVGAADHLDSPLV
jgi:hypothetical protein